MNFNTIRSTEKTQGQWESITEQDVPDIKVMQLEFLREIANKLPRLRQKMAEKFGNPGYDRGLVLKKGGESIGYVLYSTEENKNKGETFDIRQLYVAKEERAPEMISKLFFMLRIEARKQNANYISWVPGTDEIEEFTNRIGAEYDEKLDRYLLPLKKAETTHHV